MRVTTIASVGILWAIVLAASSPAQPILNRVEQLLRNQVGAQPAAAAPADGVSEPGYLGVIADDAGDGGAGVRVVSVTAGSPAAESGLLGGDLITAIDGQPIRGMDDMSRALGQKAMGTKLTITLNRAGVERSLAATLGPRPGSRLLAQPVESVPEQIVQPAPAAGPSGPRLGIRTLPLSEDVRQLNRLPDGRGAMVISVTPGSPAEQAGVPLGAVITAVDNQAVDTPQTLARAILQAGADVELTYVERGQQIRKRVALAAGAIVADVPKADAPKLELRGRPVDQGAKPQPSEVSPPAAADEATSPIAALEARIQELESRIQKLEAAAAREPTEPK